MNVTVSGAESVKRNNTSRALFPNKLTPSFAVLPVGDSPHWTCAALLYNDCHGSAVVVVAGGGGGAGVVVVVGGGDGGAGVVVVVGGGDGGAGVVLVVVGGGGAVVVVGSDEHDGPDHPGQSHAMLS